MKKLLFTLFIIGATSFAMQAQYLGLKGGLNMSNLNVEDVDSEARYGYHFGLFVNLPLSEAISIQPELLYTTKGNKVTYDFDTFLGDFNGSSTLKLNYIEIPVLLAFKVGDAVQIDLGPYVGFLANSELALKGDIEDTEDLDNDSFKNMDFGLAGGLAFNFGALQLGARYTHGFQEVQDSEISELFIGDAMNRNVQLFAALRIGSYD